VNYALSLDQFHMINVGMDSLEVLKSNIQIIKNFQPLDDEKMEEIRLALQPFYHDRGASLAWMRPGYADGVCRV
jgi:predicted aldo/keto reductase-like oxidoreductase